MLNISSLILKRKNICLDNSKRQKKSIHDDITMSLIQYHIGILLYMDLYLTFFFKSHHQPYISYTLASLFMDTHTLYNIPTKHISRGPLNRVSIESKVIEIKKKNYPFV